MNLGQSNSNINIVFLLIFLVVVVIAGFAVGAAVTPIVFPPAAAAEAENVDSLFQTFLSIGTAIFLLVEGLLVYSIIRYRHRPGDDGDAQPIHGNAMLEIVWTIIPALLVIFLSLISYDVWTRNQEVKAQENIVNGQEIEVRAVAQRFAWTFEYEAPETVTNFRGEDVPILIKDNTLHTYVGQNVHLTIQSLDVNHAFWVPAMRLKQDALPGYVADLRFRPTLASYEGEFDPDPEKLNEQSYPVVCAELCGGGHGEMVARIVVHPSEEAMLSAFWDNSVENFIRIAQTNPVEAGREIIQNYPCFSCHTLDDLGWAGVIGPALTGIGDRADERIEGVSAEEYLVRSIYFPDEFIVNGFQNQMPPFRSSMSADDLEGIVAYLCAQTSSGESACDLEHLTEIVNEYR